MVGNSDTDSVSQFVPLTVPEGTYMTQITNHSEHVWAIDQDNNLWCWGVHFGKNQDEDRQAIYQEEINNEGQPVLLKWFKEREYKMLEVKSGNCHAVVKAKDKDGNLEFFGLCGEADSTKYFGKT